MQSFSIGAFRYYSHTQNYMRKKVESMSVKKPVVPAETNVCRCRSSRSRGKARTQDRKVRCQNGESPQNRKDRPQGPSPAFP